MLTAYDALLRVPEAELGIEDVDLVALVLGMGEDVAARAYKALDTLGGVEGLIAAGVRDLVAAGFSEAAAVRLVAARDLARRARRVQVGRPIVRSAKDVFELVDQDVDARVRREVRVLCLDRRCVVRHIATVAQGSSHEVILDPAGMFAIALRYRAASVVVVVNDPTGDPTPTDGDLKAAVRLGEAGEAIGVPLVDYLIVGRQGFRTLLGAARLAGYETKRHLLVA